MTEQPNREVTVLNAALELHPAEREAYLDQACAGDAALRQQVEALLHAHEHAEDFLEGPPAGLDFTRTRVVNIPLTEKPGDKIGRYKLLQQIGEGGCGAVYMAEQEEAVRRRVALKVIKLGMDTKSVIARFEAERQALALMDHPNIAKVLDAGATETGRPYFVMELVRGIKITDFCDENKFSTVDRLKLFIQVCQAIQHAHQKGIIHRDIKPSNILVTINDGVPVPKVIDFGIAKATQGRLTDKTLFTAFDQFIGTPAYMSPEQAEMTSLDIDTRSDIYSLGVLLYELLTGKTPFDAKELLQAGLDAMRRTIRESEPLKPSTKLNTMLDAERSIIARQRQTDPPKLLNLVRGDLDWVVMKSLEKDRARRYETANGFAADIQRHLNNEPVNACPPSGVYRLQKAVRRNKGVFAAVTAIAIVLIFGVVVSTSQAIRATRAEREQIHLREQAQRAEALAKADEQKTKTEAAKSEQTAHFLKEMLQSVGPSVALGRDTTMLREILDKTAERMDKDLINEPEVELQMRLTLADTYSRIGLFQKGEKMARPALRIARALHGEEHQATAQAFLTLGTILCFGGDADEGLSCLRQALAIRRKLWPSGSPEVAGSLDKLADALRYHGMPNEAEPLEMESLDIKKKILGNDSHELCFSMNNLGLILLDLGRLSEAETLFRDAMALSVRTQGEDHPDSIFALIRLGRVVGLQGRVDEGIRLLTEGLSKGKRVFGPEHHEVAWTLEYLGDIMSGAGRLEEAIPFYREAVAIRFKQFGLQDWGLIRTFNELANLLAVTGRDSEVVQLVNKMFPLASPGQEQNALPLRQRANFYGRHGQWQRAITNIVSAIEIDPTNVLNYHTLIPLLIASKDLENYDRFCQEFLTRCGSDNLPGDDDKIAKDCLVLVSPALDLQFVGGLAETAVTLGATNRWLIYFQFTKGLAEYRLGHFHAAIDWTQKTIGGHPEACLCVEAQAVLAMAHYQMNQVVEARSGLNDALEMERAKLPGPDEKDLGSEWRDLIIARALITEAKALIDAQSAPPAK